MKINWWLKINRWLGISLLFILPIVAFFLLQNQSGEKAIWNVAIGMIFLISMLIIALVENINESMRSRLQQTLKIISDKFGRVKRKQQAGENENDSLKSPIPSSPSKPWSLFNKRSMKMKRKENEKKKVNRFERYDERVLKRITKAWRKVKEKKDKDAEEQMRVLAMQLETKKYGETDWLRRLINFFRLRSDGLEELLDEIHDRIKELEEIKKIEKEKAAEPEKPKRGAAKKRKETSIPTSPSLEDHEPNSQDTNKLPKSDLEKDTDQDEQAEEDNPPSTA